MGGVRWLARRAGPALYRDEDVPWVRVSRRPLAELRHPSRRPCQEACVGMSITGPPQGPFAAVELSQKLYVQEMDFDCVLEQSDDPAQGPWSSGILDFLKGSVLGINPETTSEFEQS